MCLCLRLCPCVLDVALKDFPLGFPNLMFCFLADRCTLGSAVHSVTIALRHFALGVDPTAAYWDFDLLDGHGGWRAEGCHITGSTGNTTTIHCTHHNNFAVLMVSTEVTLFQSSHRTPFPWLSRGLLLIMNPIHHFAQRSSHVPCQPLRDIRDLSKSCFIVVAYSHRGKCNGEMRNGTMAEDCITRFFYILEIRSWFSCLPPLLKAVRQLKSKRCSIERAPCQYSPASQAQVV